MTKYTDQKMELHLRTAPELEATLAELVAKEPIFHHPDKYGTSRADLENMTDPNFWEVGASGNRYSREYVIDTLIERYKNWPDSEDREIKNPHCLEVAQNNYLLTYTLVQDKIRTTRRSTLWRKTDTGWKILYHQGTIYKD